MELDGRGPGGCGTGQAGEGCLKLANGRRRGVVAYNWAARGDLPGMIILAHEGQGELCV
jgi:hypothetical protein